MKGYCNPGCKKTIFQDGKQFPKDVVIKTKNKSVKAFATKLIKGMRKEIFGKKLHQNLLAETKVLFGK